MTCFFMILLLAGLGAGGYYFYQQLMSKYFSLQALQNELRQAHVAFNIRTKELEDIVKRLRSEVHQLRFVDKKEEDVQ